MLINKRRVQMEFRNNNKKATPEILTQIDKSLYSEIEKQLLWAPTIRGRGRKPMVEKAI